MRVWRWGVMNATNSPCLGGSFQWVKGSRTDARMRAAVLYDKQLNERARAIELYREEKAKRREAELAEHPEI